MLRRALDDYALYRFVQKTTTHKKLFEDAKEWIFCDTEEYEDPDDEFMSCRNVCRILGISLSMVRQAALTRTRDDVKKISYGGTN